MEIDETGRRPWAAEAFARLPGVACLVVDAEGVVRALGGETLRVLGLDRLLDQPLRAAPARLRGALLDVLGQVRGEGHGERVVASAAVRIVGRSVPEGCLLTATDISALLGVQAVAAADRARFGAGPVVTYRCLARPPWTIAEVSENVVQWGVRPEALLGQPFPAWVHPEDVASAEAEAATQVAAGESHFLLQYRIHTPDGGVYWIRDWNVVTRDFDGRPAWLDGYLIDVTELNESRLHLQQALDSAQAGTFVWDLRRQASHWDARCRVLFSLGETGAPGYDAWAASVHPDDLPGLEANLPRVLAGESDEQEYRVRGPAGWRIVRTWLSVMRDLQGQPLRLIGTVRDVTDEVEARQRLERAVSALEQRNHDLQEFAYVASHDLQEPLRMVSTFVQLLSRRYLGRLDDDADRYIGYVVEGASRMQALIRELLDFARLGQDRSTPVATPLESVVQAALGDLRASLDEHRAEVTWSELPVLPVDPGQLRRLFVNLVGNALKFRSAEPPRIRISGRAVAGGHEIDVVDNGIGFESEHAERIFAIFKRLHRHDRYPGTGMGLAICRRIVERHEGTIRAEGRPGQGATFTVFLPAEVRT